LLCILRALPVRFLILLLAARLGQELFELRDPPSRLGQLASLLVESPLQLRMGLLGALRPSLHGRGDPKQRRTRVHPGNRLPWRPRPWGLRVLLHAPHTASAHSAGAAAVQAVRSIISP
jgi:hypothetical protein